MNFIYVIHLLYWNQLTDLIIHSRSNRSNKSNRNNSIHCNNKGARTRTPTPAQLYQSLLLFLFLLCVIRTISNTSSA